MMLEQIEQSGKNAVDHPCQMKVEIPGDDGEPSSFKKCTILALIQCSKCQKWICGSEELMHAIRCVKCDLWFCPVDYAAHNAEGRCKAAA